MRLNQAPRQLLRPRSNLSNTISFAAQFCLLLPYDVGFTGDVWSPGGRRSAAAPQVDVKGTTCITEQEFLAFRQQLLVVGLLA